MYCKYLENNLVEPNSEQTLELLIAAHLGHVLSV